MRHALAVSLLVLPLLAGCGESSRSASGPGATASAAVWPDLAALREDVPYGDADRYMHVDVLKSVVTETRRRLYFETAAATRALLDHGGGTGAAAEPLVYPAGTTFVAESLSDVGDVLHTEVIRVGESGEPEFLSFGEGGQSRDTATFAGEHGGAVPGACRTCHLGSRRFHPMLSFPIEPMRRQVVVDERYRDLKTALRLHEGQRGARGIFGVYGTLWLSRLAVDARDKTLLAGDVAGYEKLKARYPETFGAE